MSKSFFCSRDFGLYECENWTYDATVPVWTHVGQTISTSCFAIDLNDPEEFQAVAHNATISVRRPTHYSSEDWQEVFTKTAAETLAGESLDSFGWVEINNATSKEGHMYCRAKTDAGYPNYNDLYIFKSADYGLTWAIQGSVKTHMYLRDIGGIWVGRVTGDAMYVTENHGLSANAYAHYSSDEGATWAAKGGTLGGSLWLSRIMIDPASEAKSFAGKATDAVNLTIAPTVAGSYNVMAKEDAGIGIYYGYGGGWISAYNSKYIRVAKDTTLYYSDEEGAEDTWTEAPINVPGSGAFEKAIWGWDRRPQNVAVAVRTGAESAYPQSLVSTDDIGTTWHMKSGANASTRDTGAGDSIPWNCAGVAENGLYLVNPGDVYTSVVAMRALPTAGTVYADGVQMGALATGSTVYSHGVEQESPRPPP